MITFLDSAVNTFFSNSGGSDLIAFLISVIIIWAIISALIKPFEV